MPARTASTKELHHFAKFAAFEQIAEDRQTAVERQPGGQQGSELTGELEQLLLADLAFFKQRPLLAYRADRAFRRHRDAQRHAAHFAQARHHALLGIGLHHALDDFASLIGGPILVKRHGDFLRYDQTSQGTKIS